MSQVRKTEPSVTKLIVFSERDKYKIHLGQFCTDFHGVECVFAVFKHFRSHPMYCIDFTCRHVILFFDITFKH